MHKIQPRLRHRSAARFGSERALQLLQAFSHALRLARGCDDCLCGLQDLVDGFERVYASPRQLHELTLFFCIQCFKLGVEHLLDRLGVAVDVISEGLDAIANRSTSIEKTFRAVDRFRSTVDDIRSAVAQRFKPILELLGVQCLRCFQTFPPVSAYLSPLLIDSTVHGGEGV